MCGRPHHTLRGASGCTQSSMAKRLLLRGSWTCLRWQSEPNRLARVARTWFALVGNTVHIPYQRRRGAIWKVRGPPWQRGMPAPPRARSASCRLWRPSMAMPAMLWDSSRHAYAHLKKKQSRIMASRRRALQVRRLCQLGVRARCVFRRWRHGSGLAAGVHGREQANLWLL